MEQHHLLYGRTWLSLLIADRKKDNFSYLNDLLDNIESYSVEDISKMDIKPIHKKNLLKLKDYISQNGNPLQTKKLTSKEMEDRIMKNVTFSNVTDVTGDLFRCVTECIIDNYVVSANDYILLLPSGESCLYHTFKKITIDNRFQFVKSGVTRTQYMGIQNGNIDVNSLSEIDHSRSMLPIIDLTDNNKGSRNNLPGVTFY